MEGMEVEEVAIPGNEIVGFCGERPSENDVVGGNSAHSRAHLSGGSHQRSNGFELLYGGF